MSWLLKHCAVIGSNGGIGSAFVSSLLEQVSVKTVHCFSRSGMSKFADDRAINYVLNYEQPETIDTAAAQLQDFPALDLVIVATGLLHDDDGFGPEKRPYKRAATVQAKKTEETLRIALNIQDQQAQQQPIFTLSIWE